MKMRIVLLVGLLLFGQNTVFAEKKEEVKIPKKTEEYTLYDIDGNFVDLSFWHGRDKIEITIQPPKNKPNKEELEVITIPVKEDRGSSKDDKSSSDKEFTNGGGTRITFNPVTYNDTLGHWAGKEIEYMVSLGLLKGYPDGTFRPDNPISKAEFAALLERTIQYVKKEDMTLQELTFHDVNKADWFYSSVKKLEKRGNISIVNYPTRKLQPLVTISRQEMGLWISKEVNPSTKVLHFTDSHQIKYKEAVRKVVASNLLQGYPDGTFRPDGNTTRAEVASILVRWIKQNI
ncbi:S-layer homology domain-containing protein (plasmid) [Brevibacillus laterosporus]|uniref:S-layer homology domain-containing protein n=1 Tax=Brevibacillus laterosporus TaxID=1465 RepID=UPI000E6BED14|nr:S-layer homology domain-containing protein [Brevibacillus laterosporus]AYB41733.1 S-layer homology domain-containing protein [Brevibacillus laterosporus]